MEQKIRRIELCNECDFSAASKQTIGKHKKRVHLGIIVKLYCDECDYSAAYKESIDRHMKRDHLGIKETRFCNECDFSAGSNHVVKKHKRRVHLGIITKIQCDKCDYSAVAKLSVERHKQTTHLGIIEKSICNECGYSAASKQSVDKHKDRVHLGFIKKTNCDECDYSAVSKWSVDQHKKVVHLGIIEKIMCDNCDYSAVSKQSVDKHKQVVHLGIIEKVICNECDFSAISKQSVSQHMKRDHLGIRFKCTLCNFKTTREGRIDKHMESKHLNLEFACDLDKCAWTGKSNESLKSHKLNKHTRIRSFKCDQCDLVSNNRNNIRRHVNTVHSKIKYTCVKCKMEYATTYGLRKHECRLSCSSCDYKAQWQKEIDFHHMNNHTEHLMNEDVNENNKNDIKIETEDLSSKLPDKSNYSCKLCPKTFSFESYLLKHFNALHGNKRVKCIECDVTFKNKDTLKSHKRAHTAKDSVKCKYCNFITISNPNPSNDPMIRHLSNSHWAELPFECSLCPEKFPTYKQRVRHMNCHEEAKPFKCEKCHRAFMQACKLKEHMEIHNTGVKLPCLECHKTFPSQRILKCHERIHTEEHKLKLQEANTFFCPISDCFNKVGFRSAQDLEVHNMSHTGEKPFICTVCNYATSTIDKLRIHERRHMGEGPEGKPYSCSFCNKRFRASGTLAHHLLIHNDTKMESCSECDKKFRHKTTLRIHMRTHTGEKPYSCKVEGCSVKCATQSAVTAHAKHKHNNERKFSCGECDLTCKTKSTLRQHQQRVHDPNRIQKFKCTQCLKLFYTEWDLKVHTRKHTGEKLFPCENCEQRYGSAQALQYHVNSVHKLTERSHVCGRCGRAFRHYGSLRVHTQRHLRDKSQRTHKCDACKKSFFSAKDLEYHMKTHSEVRPYPCNVCSRRFKSVKCLTNHMPLHEGKEIACEFCFRKYSKSGDWLSHVKTVHKGEKPFKCSNCSGRFIDRFEIRVHQETCRFKTEVKVEDETEGEKKNPYDRYIAQLEDPNMRSATTNDDSGRLRHICTICEADFSEAGTLRDHKYKKHNTGPVPSKLTSTEIHDCDKCEFTTNTRKGFNSHRKIHKAFPNIEQ